MTDLVAQGAFRRIWLAGLLSTLGTEITRLGLFLYLFNERDSVFDLALLVLLKTLPGALIAPIAGLLIDRVDKRRLMVACDLLQMLYLVVLLISPTLLLIYVTAALQSVTSAVFEPARRAAFPLVVDKGDIPEANGIDFSTRNLMMILGPVLGAEIYLLGGLFAVLLADAASYLASALFLLGLRPRQVARQAHGGPSAWQEIRAGWRYFTGHRLVLHLTLLFFISMACSGIWVPLAPFFIRDVLGASERILGYQIGIFGLGGMLGGMLAPRLTARVATGGILLLALLLESVQLTLYSLVPDVHGSHIILFFWGIAVSLIAVSAYSILQTRVEEAYLGRVFALVNQAENLAMLLAMGVAMALGSVLSSQLIFLAAGVLYLSTVALTSLTRNGRALWATR